MILDFAKLLVRFRAYWALVRGLREFIDDYPFDEIALKALRVVMRFTHLVRWRPTALQYLAREYTIGGASHASRP